MTVRAKFQVQEIKRNFFLAGAEVTLRPCYDDKIPEDQRYHKATPSGELKMQVTNDSVLQHLQMGKFYYLDITEVPEEKQ